MKILVLTLAIMILFFGCLGGEQKKTESTVEPPKNDSAVVPSPPPSYKPNDTPAPQPVDKNPFKSKYEGYSYYSSPMFLIYFPEGWGIDDSQSGIFEFFAPLEDDNDRISEDFVVEIWEGNESTAEEFESFEKQLLKPEDVIKKKESIQYKDRDAFTMEIEGKIHDGPEPMFFKTIFFRNGKFIYRLHYAIEKSKLDKYQPIMETILDRFKIGSG